MNQARFGSQQHLGMIKRTCQLPRRVLVGNWASDIGDSRKLPKV